MRVYGKTWPRLSPSTTRAPGCDLDPQSPAQQASTLAKSYCNSIWPSGASSKVFNCFYPNSTYKWLTLIASPHVQTRRGNHYGKTWPKVISILYKSTRDRHVPALVWTHDLLQANTLAKSYCNSLYCCYSKLLQVTIIASPFLLAVPSAESLAYDVSLWSNHLVSWLYPMLKV